MKWKHWVARALHPYKPFHQFADAKLFWMKLGETFPDLISAVLMPNHLHLILPAEVEASRKLAGLLGAMSAHCKLIRPWQPIPNPAEIPDIFHLRRQIRYIALNPCRKKLCQDPLAWYWSTYREVIGASAKSIQNEVKLSAILIEPAKNLRVRFHGYVSGDPSVNVSGTHFPKSISPKNFPEQSINEILSAAAGALRVDPSQLREKGPLRKLFIHSAYRHGWRRPIYLAQLCEISPSAVHQFLQKEAPPGLEVVDLCLGDVRLRPSSSKNIAEIQMNNKLKAWSTRFL